MCVCVIRCGSRHGVVGRRAGLQAQRLKPAEEATGLSRPNVAGGLNGSLFLGGRAPFLLPCCTGLKMPFGHGECRLPVLTHLAMYLDNGCCTASGSSSS